MIWIFSVTVWKINSSFSSFSCWQPPLLPWPWSSCVGSWFPKSISLAQSFTWTPNSHISNWLLVISIYKYIMSSSNSAPELLKFFHDLPKSCLLLILLSFIMQTTNNPIVHVILLFHFYPIFSYITQLSLSGKVILSCIIILILI